MRFEYDWYLIEEAVFREMLQRETAGKVEDYLAYRRRLDQIHDSYQEPSRASGAAQGETRRLSESLAVPGTVRADRQGVDEALRREHLVWFKRLGFWQVIVELLEEYPLLDRGIELLSLQAAERRNAEATELFVREEDGKPEELVRTLVLRIYPESFLDLSRLRAFLRRELCHASDMLDPAFSYRPDLGTSACTAAQENLVRDRYAVLWDIYAESRNYGPDRGVPPRLRALAGRAFAGLPQEAVEERVRRVWTGENITHDELVALAGAHDHDSEGCALVSNDAASPAAGTPCPACGFPTHQWVPTPEGYSCLQCSEMRDVATPAGSR